MITWRHEDYEGVGPDTQEICAIPQCGKRTQQRGLCDTCYHAWWRHGMDGLDRRAKRLAGILPKQLRVPTDTDAAIEMLIDTYEQWMAAGDDDAQYEKFKRRLLRICDALGMRSFRKRHRKFRDASRRRLIEKIGIEEYRKRQAAAQREYRRVQKARESQEKNQLRITG